MSAQSANEDSPLGEVIGVLEPHASVVKLGLALFAFAFVGVSVFRSSAVSANHLSIAPYTAVDIGSPRAGSQEPVTGGYNVSASGSDIFWTSDSFRYLYQRAPSSDFSMTAKIAWISNTDSWAKAGVMVRASTAANSPHLFMMVTPVNGSISNGADLQYRTTAGGWSGHDGENRTPSLNRWLRITKTGTTYKAYMSSDGVNFTQYGTSKSLNLGSTPLVGLAATSHNNSVYTNVQFRDVKFTPSSSVVQPPQDPTPLPIPSPSVNLLPDLTVTNFALSKTNPALGEGVTANIAIKNQGAMIPPCGSYGDVDLNGVITSADSLLILRYVSGVPNVLTNDEQKRRANVTNDFTTTGSPIINSSDSLHILRFLDNTLRTFSVCGTVTPPVQPSSGPFLYTFYNNAGIAACNSAGQNSAAIPRLRAGESTSFNVSFNAPANAGSFSALIFADSTCIVNETDNNNNQATASYSVIQPCTGTPFLQVIPTSVEKGKNIELSAGGLSNCASSDVIKFDSTTGGGTWDKPLINCNLGLAGNGFWGCSASFTADWSAGGPYSVRALLDRGGNGSIEAMSNVVNVTVTAPAPQPGPSQQAICPGLCTKEMIRAYVNNVVPEPYRSTIHLMLDRESDGGDWGALANDGWNCPGNDPCHGVLQFKIGTWRSAQGYSGGTWTAGDVYPDFVSVWDLRGAYPDQNVWNPFGQINIAYQYLRNCWYTHWPWLPRPSYCAAPGVPF